LPEAPLGAQAAVRGQVELVAGDKHVVHD
jgi:hypothetical protein